MHTKEIDPIQAATGEAKSFTPSFLDRFMRAVQRLPLPYWLTYLIFFILESLLIHILAWTVGWVEPFRVNELLFLYPLWLWGPLAIMTYLNGISAAALASFSPLLNIEEAQLKRLKDEFTTMPTSGVIINSVLWSIVYAFFNYLAYDTFFVQYRVGNILTPVFILVGLFSFAIGSAIYIHSLRQLWLVNRTVKLIKRFNLFRLEPVYAFSRLTARTGISWMALLGLTLLLFPLELATGLLLAVLFIQVLMALAAFVLPLRFVNQHLVLEKRRLLAELNRRIELKLEKLHDNVDGNDLEEAGRVSSALGGLHIEQQILAGISTWPWRGGTLTGFLTAIVLPIALLLLQIGIDKWFGR